MSNESVCGSVVLSYQEIIPNVIRKPVKRVPVCSNAIIRKAVSKKSAISMKRNPVSREEVAYRVGQQTATDHEKNLYYMLFDKLIISIVRKTAYWDTQEEFDDVIYDVHAKIISGLHYYRPERLSKSGKIIKTRATTWITICARGYIYERNGKYFKRKKMTPVGEVSEYQTKKTYEKNKSNLVMDFKTSIIELHKRYPHQRAWLYEMFGNPHKDNYCPPESFNLKKIQSRIGGVYSRQWQFLKNKIVPFLQERVGQYV